MYIIEIEEDKVEEKTQELNAKISAYIIAQQYQLIHGGPGPVAEFDVMKIVSEHNGEFQVVYTPDLGD
jgi:hypothetical protein